MNRRKKIKKILEKRDKRASAKLSTRHKPRYISKAEREKNEGMADSVALDG